MTSHRSHILACIIFGIISIALFCFPYITYTCDNCTKDSTSILENYQHLSDGESFASAFLLSAVWLPLLVCLEAFFIKKPFSTLTKVLLWIQVAFAIVAWFAGAFIMSFHVSPHKRTSVFGLILSYEALFTLDLIIFLFNYSGFGLVKKMFTSKK